MKKIQIKKINVFLLNFFVTIFACEIDITQKRATCKIIRKQEAFYTGIIKIPKCNNPNLELCMCYNGNIIKVKRNDNLFMIKDSKKEKINILFASPENFSADSQDNTVLYFKLKKGNSYEFFELSKNLTDDKTKYIWEVKDNVDLPKKDNKTIVPLDTLIIPIDSNNIVISFEEKTSKLNTKIYNLPTVIIESENCADIEEQINKSCISIMKIKPFNINQEKKEVRQDNLKVCLVN